MDEQQLPQPGADFAISALQAEIAEQRQQNAKLRDERVYLSAMIAQHEQTIGTLLAQLSQAQPDPEASQNEG